MKLSKPSENANEGCADLRAQLAAMTAERDALRLRCQELLEVERLATEHDSGAYDSAKCVRELMAQLAAALSERESFSRPCAAEENT